MAEQDNTGELGGIATARAADPMHRVLKSSLLLFGAVLFAYCACIVLHELGHAAAMWATGMNIQRIVVDPFGRSGCVTRSPLVWPTVLFWSGAVLGTLGGLVLAALAWRRRQSVAILGIMTGVVCCADNGLNLIYDAATRAGGDATWLVLYGTPRAVIFAAGSVMLGAGILLGCISVPLIGIRPEDGVKARAAVFAAGILSWAGIPAVAWALGGGAAFRHWAVSAGVAVAIVLCASAGTKLLQSRWRRNMDGAKGIEWTKVGVVNTGGFGLLLLLVVLGGRSSFEVEKVNQSVDYIPQLNELARAGRPEHLNAAPYYDRAVELCIEPPGRINLDMIKEWPAGLSAGQRGLWEEWLQSNVAALSQFELGTRCPCYWREYETGPTLLAVSPSPAVFHVMILGVLLRARASAMAGRIGDAMDDIIVCHRCGLHMSSSIFEMEQWEGISISSVVCRVALLVLDSDTADTVLLEEFQRRLEQVARKQPASFDLRGEKLVRLDIIQGIFTDDKRGDGRLDMRAMLKFSAGFTEYPLSNDVILQCAKRRRRETTEGMERAFQYISDVLKRTPWELEKKDIFISEGMAEVADNNPLIFTLIPNFYMMIHGQARYRTELRALIAVVALLRYKADYDQFPSELTMLARQGYLKELPIDPYSGRPLVYRRSGDDFILYSFGADFDDDGGTPSYWGKPDKGGDQVFWPLQRPPHEPRIETEQ
ncbi:MAG: M50 family metallopeptidase [Phycisphaerales bacterium]|nr:MAG: M50 family metallopeptidase [Phycisphaerales bacterium]